LGGEAKAAEALFRLIPKKTALTTTKEIGDLVMKKLKCDSVFPNDIMTLTRDEVKLKDPDRAVRLSRDDEVQYSSFGSSFSVTNVSMEWIRESLDRDVIFGVFIGDELVSVASLVAWLPQLAAILGVETKPEFRNRGFGSIVVSAAVREALKRSNLCSLFVREDNAPAIALYRAMGFRKIAEELCIDLGTGLVP
jgi:predicted GNAT family acetyltransferase